MKKSIIVLLVGLIFVGVGVFTYFRGKDLSKNCTEATIATVVDMKEELDVDSDGSRYMYYPIIEYTVNGEKIEVTMGSGSTSPAYRINEKIDILYNPSKPKEYIIKGDNTSIIITIVFSILGLAITGYGIKMIICKEG